MRLENIILKFNPSSLLLAHIQKRSLLKKSDI